MAVLVFIGLGHMGTPMVRHLLKAGHEVWVHDVNPASISVLMKEGAKHAESLSHVLQQAEVIFTMVQTGDQVHDICMNEKNGIFIHAKPHTLYIDCSSIDISMTRALHDLAKEHHIQMLDVPVSGGVAGAEAGTLTMMAGGTERAFLQAESYLKLLGKKIIHAGLAGSGQAAKICNNLLLAISMIGVSEAFTLAEKLGLDPKIFFDISSHSSGQCWAMTSYCPVPGILENVPSSRQYQPGFTAKMMQKDLHLGQHAAESVNAVIPLGAVSAELYTLFVNEGHGDLDFSAIIKLISGK